jgi:hypothetical protein
MIFIDEDTWPPSLHGTGSEDYFNHAWGMQDNAFPMNGSALHESIIPGYQVSYRFHLADPIHFAKRIAVTIEHGHANHLADDWSSTAYWYQTLPSPIKSISPVGDRIPPPLRRSGRVPTGKRRQIRFIRMTSEPPWKLLASDLPGTKHSAGNTSTGKWSVPVNPPAKISHRQKRFVPDTTRRSGRDCSTFNVQRQRSAFGGIGAFGRE